MSNPIPYDEAYFDNYRAYAGSAIEGMLNAGRVALLSRHAAPGAKVVDVGVGSGAFIRAAASAGFAAGGCDINETAIKWLRKKGLYSDDLGGADVVTFWDSLEHMVEPEITLRRIAKGAVVLVAIPIFDDLRRVRASRHYKPREHFYHFTEPGFIDWMAMHGFRLTSRSDHEVAAGREAIGAFGFCNDLPDYHDHVLAYREMHASRHYGSSATELHLDAAANVVREFSPRSILDYGCGRSDLLAHFWADGARRLGRYDPAIPQYKQMPDDKFDLAFCCDVMEHIPVGSVDRILSELRAKTKRVFFTISTKLARAKLPDGRNAHVTLLTNSEWLRWIRDYFAETKALPSPLEHELVLIATTAAAEDKRAA